MGSWGVGIFSNDVGADIRQDFRDLIAEGHSAHEATDVLYAQYGIGPGDGPDDNDFWLGLAAVQHKTGHVAPGVLERALEIASSDAETERWVPADRSRRRAALAKLAATLEEEPPAPKRIRRRVKIDTALTAGQHVLFEPKELSRGIVLRVTGVREDKGGRYPTVVALQWDGSATGLALPHRLVPFDDPQPLRPRGDALGFTLCGERNDPEDLTVLPARVDARTPIVASQTHWVVRWSEVHEFFGSDGRPSRPNRPPTFA